MRSDSELLRDFAGRGNEEAFVEIYGSRGGPRKIRSFRAAVGGDEAISAGAPRRKAAMTSTTTIRHVRRG
jgi:hypothetical protein